MTACHVPLLIASPLSAGGIIRSVMLGDWKFELRTEMDQVTLITHHTSPSQNQKFIQKLPDYQSAAFSIVLITLIKIILDGSSHGHNSAHLQCPMYK